MKLASSYSEFSQGHENTSCQVVCLTGKKL